MRFTISQSTSMLVHKNKYLLNTKRNTVAELSTPDNMLFECIEKEITVMLEHFEKEITVIKGYFD